ncbi:MAG: nitrous oxide reductase family maturation protein NosD [Candidatus Promineifilaceae bacterium]|nr:nitrous oxide reductase family maturation protein NosD [Candidatus Promineifilaceae bacterium]
MRYKLLIMPLLLILGLLIIRPVLAQEHTDTIVTTAENLAEVIAVAEDGDTIEVNGGVYHGTLLIDKSLTLTGHDWPVIDGNNEGTVVNISGAGTTFRGFLIKNSGSSLAEENSGIAVLAPHVTVENNRFEDTLFGIYLKEGHNGIIRGNKITSKDVEVQRRGDPIRLWYSTDVLIEDNIVENGRDVVLWYSERLLLRNNEVSGGRYGLHFMYCDDATIENNRLMNNSVGAFLMYSRRVNMTNNTIANNRGPSGYGIGLKDMDDAVIVENLFLNNRIGAHLDTSPREVDSIGEYTGNVFAYNDIGVQLMPSVRRNMFSSNSFVENEEQVTIAGGGTLQENSWTVNGTGNYWSDYAGFDADNDGRGDIEYRSERLFENLMQQEPKLRLFLYSPASNAIDFASRAFPLVRPKPKLVDEQPFMAPMIPADAPSLPQEENPAWIFLAAALIVAALALITLPRLHRRRYHFDSNETLTSRKY